MFVDAIHDVLATASLPRTKTEAPRRPEAPEPVSRTELPLDGSEAKEEQKFALAEPAEDAGSGEEAAARLRQRFEEIQSQGYLRELKMEHSVTDDGRILVKILDARTDKVIREVPPEDQVEMSKRLAENLGVLFDKQA